MIPDWQVPGSLVVVGVGPGDPQLLTLAAVEAIRQADTLAYPTSGADGRSFAREIVADFIGPGTEEMPFAVPMTGDGAAEAAYDRAADGIERRLEACGNVVLLCEGDPMLYGSAASVMERVGQRFDVDVIPGITAASAAAAVTRTSLARGNAPFTVLPASAPPARIDAALAGSGALVIYKVGSRFDDIARRIAEAGRTGTLVVRATLPEEEVVPLAEAGAGPKPYFSLVVLPPAQQPAEPATRADRLTRAVVLVLSPTALPVARKAREALAAIGMRTEIHGLASRIAPDEVDRVFPRLEAHAQALFRSGRPLVGVMSTGIIVRVLARSIRWKVKDPAVVAVADDGSAIVPVLGAHAQGRRIAETLGAALGTRPAHTTLSEVRFDFSLEEPPRGWVVADRAPFKALAADLGRGIGIDAPGIPFLADVPKGPNRVRATIRREDDNDAVPTYVHQAVAIGMGAERGADPAAAVALAERVLAQENIDPRAVGVVATLDVKADEPAIAAVAERLGATLRVFDAERLAKEEPNLATPSEVVRAAVGVAGVAEAAALAAFVGEARLLVPKRVGERVTLALAAGEQAASVHAGRARGHLAVVGIGPGTPAWRTPEAENLLAVAQEYVGYSLYLDLVEDLRGDTRQRHDFDLGDETERVRFALERAGEGRTVALVSSGDPGIYAMATLAAELLETGDISDAARRVALTVAPGVSAAQAAAARVGAPLGHDFAFVSLSDLLTPWAAIERRLRAVAEADFVVALYNPRSRRRTTQLERAAAILSAHRPAQTPVVIAGSVGRPAESIVHTTLGEFDPAAVDMLATVIIGASTTRRFVRGDGRALVYTPRGYEVTP